MSQNKEQHSKDISRKDALKKMGSYAALAALATMVILNPQKAQAQSGIDSPGFGGGRPTGVRKVKSKNEYNSFVLSNLWTLKIKKPKPTSGHKKKSRRRRHTKSAQRLF